MTEATQGSDLSCFLLARFWTVAMVACLITAGLLWATDKALSVIARMGGR